MAKGVGEMVRSRQVMQAEGSARTEGARRATGVRADAAVAGAGVLGPGQRWSASRKRDVVLRLLRGESLDAVSREVGVEIYRLEEWKERALAGLELGLKDPAGEPAGAALDAAKRHIGELSMENELLRERARAAERRRPLPMRRVAAMSATTSATTGRRYGLQRVCRAWERSRSALYARRAQAERRRQGDVPARRGPKPLLSDEQLLAAIRADLARSPFQGEGHRKVHARLRLLDGIRVAQTQVLRVMRTQGLLSPHRGRQGDPKLHDGTIITLAPQVMWGTDGVRVFTVDDGWVWTFAAVDHWNAECVGWHVCKVGSRFAALEPIAQGLRRIYGTVDADVAPRAGAADGPRQSVPLGPLPPADPILGHPSQLRLPRGTGNEWRRGTVESHAQGASNLRPGLSEPRRRARRRRRVRRAVQSELAPREARISDADSKRARSTSYTRSRSRKCVSKEPGAVHLDRR